MSKEEILEQLTSDLMQLQSHLTKLTLKDYRRCMRLIKKLEKNIRRIYD